MKSAQQINQEFRKEIRNRQKQEYFRRIRYQIIHSDISIKNFSQIYIPEQMDETLNPYDERSLKHMIERVNNNNNCKRLKLCNRIVAQNIHVSLVQNLKNNVHIDLTMELIASILSKQNVKVAHRFLQAGTIQQLLKLAESNTKYIGISMNILGNVIIENVEHAQYMLMARMHEALGRLAEKMILRYQNISREEQDIGYDIMWASFTLCMVENAEPYKEQFLEILNFSLQVLQKKDLYHKVILQIIFLVGYPFRQETLKIVPGILNKILNNSTSEYQNNKQLLILIKLLSPIEVNYAKISSLIPKSNTTYAYYGLRVLQRIALDYPEAIPKNGDWWESLYLKLLKPGCKELYVKLLEKAQIRSEWVYPILKQILQTCQSSITLIHEVLIFITMMFESCQSHQQYKLMKFYLKNYGLNFKFQELYDHNNITIQQKSESLLSVINSDSF